MVVNCIGSYESCCEIFLPNFDHYIYYPSPLWAGHKAFPIFLDGKNHSVHMVIVVAFCHNFFKTAFPPVEQRPD